MAGFENFLARSVKDVGADKIVAALFAEVKNPTPKRPRQKAVIRTTKR